MNKWTPGPWHFEANEEDDMVYVCHEGTVSPDTTVCMFEGEDPADIANAHLIAAAPEMYSLLQNAFVFIEKREIGPVAEILSRAIIETLKKARGEE